MTWRSILPNVAVDMNNRSAPHRVRCTQDLAGIWDFAFLGDVEADEVSPGDIPFDDIMLVPGCFDAAPRYSGKRGLAAYRRSVRFSGKGRHRLYLDGVHHVCTVLLDGEVVGTHHGGFTRFAIDFVAEEDDAQSGKMHELLLLVDNRVEYERCPLHLPYFDWYHYGGIARGAELHYLSESWIEEVRVETVDLSQRRVRITVNCREAGGEVGSPTSRVIVAVDGIEVPQIDVNVTEDGQQDPPDAPLARTAVCEVSLPDAALWSPESPSLHEAHVRLSSGEHEDDFVVRFGIRTIEASDGAILLNGKPIRLFGFNRHELHPSFGHAVPGAIKVADLQLLREMGCNFIRGSHYPPDAELLDLCDELGMLYWCEAIGWQHTAQHLGDERFLAAQELHIDEMVREHFNHPSVIIWGLLNESESHEPAAKAGYERLIDAIRSRDGSRPISYASNHFREDLCFGLVDIISVNAYPGWYIGEVDGLPTHIDEIISHIDSTGHADKPIILSEIGAGAVPGFRDWNRQRWSEEYQVELLGRLLDVFVGGRDERPRLRLNGLAIWQFCDMRASDSPQQQLRRPRGFNNKGVVDEWRRPKLAFSTIRDRMGTFPKHHGGR